ncbi:hypothetical protein SAMN05443545_103259 [Aidingimonas halophila]|uniref:Uncharacterized protein n=1 Tax=Aidingimonas halophila TaxID=574349 RepID=A0A1H2XPR1_9GAMM|nr:hypothetical protein SAMN05443545_103259 [Aidingimonas halophila]
MEVEVWRRISRRDVIREAGVTICLSASHQYYPGVSDISSCIGNRGMVYLLFQTSPQPMKLAIQSGIVQFGDTTPGQDDDINSRKPMLSQAKGLARHTFDAVTIYRTASAFLADHEPKPRMPRIVIACQGQ